MPSLGSLWYSIGIDTSQLDAQLKAVEKKLEKQGFTIDTSTLKNQIERAVGATPFNATVNFGSARTTLETLITSGKYDVKVEAIASELFSSIKSALNGWSGAEARILPKSNELRKAVEDALLKSGFEINIGKVKGLNTTIKNVLGTAHDINISVDPSKLSSAIQKAAQSYNGKDINVAVKDKFLQDSIRTALSVEKFPIKVIVDKAEAQEAVRRALQAAGLQSRGFTADDKRAWDAQSRRMEAEAKAAADNALAQKRLGNAHRQAASDTDAHTRSSASLSNALKGNVSMADELGRALGAAFSGYALKSFIDQVVELGGELEHQKIALETIYGTPSKMESLFGQIKDLARNSPFGVMELTKNVKQLSAYGVAYNEVYDTAKRLADISAATSVDIQRLILAFGKTKNRTFLDGLEAKQFAYANIPIYDMLSKKLTELEGKFVSVKDVMGRIKKREIGFDMVKDILWDMTDEGGKFYNMQEKLADSLKTSRKLIKDNIELMYADIAESFVGDWLKGMFQMIQKLTREWKTMGAGIGAAVAALGVYKAATLAHNVVAGQAVAAAAKQHASLKMQRYHAKLAAQSYRALTKAEEENYIASSGLAKIKGINVLWSKKLTAAEADVLYTKKMLTREDILRLVALKKLTAADAQYVLTTKGMTAADIQEMNAQIARAAAAKKSTVIMRQLAVAGASVVNSLRSMFSAAIPLALIGAGVGMIAKYYENVKKAKDASDSFTKKGRDGFEDLIKKSEELNSKDLSKLPSSQISTYIEEMKTTLKDYSLTAQETFDKVFGADNNGKIRSQKEQFEMLRDAVNETAEAYRNMKNGNKSNLFTSKDSKTVDKAGEKSADAAIKTADARDDLSDISDKLDEIFTKIEIHKRDNQSSWITDKEATAELQKQLSMVETQEDKLRVLSDYLRNNQLIVSGDGKTNIGEISAELDKYLIKLEYQQQKEKEFNDSIIRFLNKRQSLFREKYKDNWKPQTNLRQAEEYLQEIKAFVEASEKMSSAQKEFVMDMAYESIGKMSPRLREMRENVEKLVKTMQTSPGQFGLTKELLEYVKTVQTLQELSEPDRMEAVERLVELDPTKYVLLSDDVNNGAERYMTQIKDALIKNAEEKYPELSSQIHSLIESDEFTAFINLKIKNGWQESVKEAFGNLEQWQQQMYLAAIPSNDIRMALIDALAGTQTVSEATDALRKMRKEAKSVIENEGPILLKVMPSLDLSQPFNPHLFDDADPVTKLVAQTVLNAINKLNAAENTLNAHNIPLADPTKGKKGNKQGSQKDEVAERMKHRLDILKKAYSQYKKEIELMSKDAAMSRLKESGIFDELFSGKDAINNFDDYEQTLRKLLADAEASLKGLTEKDKNFKGRHDLVISLRTLLNLEIPHDKQKEALDKAKAELDALVKDFTSKWDFHNKIFDLTGDSDIAGKLAFGGEVEWQTKSQMLQSILDKQLSEKGLEVSLSLSDEEAKEKLKGTPLYDLLWKPTKEAKAKEEVELEINVAKALADVSTIAEKIQTQIGLRDRAEKELRSAVKADGSAYSEDEVTAYLKQYNDKINELQSSMLELLPVWEQIFGDHQYQSYGQIQKASDMAKQIVDNAQIKKNKEGKPVSFTSIFIDAEGKEQKITGKISQLEKLRKAIDELYKEGEKKNPFKTLWKALQAVFNGDWKDKSTAEKIALIGQSAADCADLVGTLAGQLSEMFEAIGDDATAEAMADIEGVMSSVSNIGKGFAQGGIIGGIAAAAGEAIGWVTKAFQASARHKEALQLIMDETLAQQREYNLLLMEQNLLYEKASTIFGDDTYSKARNAVEVLRDAYSQLNEEIEGTDKQKRAQKTKSFIAGLFGYKDPQAEIKELYAGLADIEIKTGHKKTGLFGWGKGKDIYSSILDVYPDLIDANGKFNASLAETIINTRVMSDEDKAALQNMIDLAEQAEAAYEELNGFMTDIFGELGNTMSDALVSAFVNGTDAAETFYESVSNMLESLAKQMIYSVTLAPIMEKAQDMMMDVMKDPALSDEQRFEAWTDILGGMIDDAIDQQGRANDLFSKYQDMAAAKGFDIFKPDSEQKSGLTAGLQSLTENTGDLLASYLNTMRADTSVMSGYVESINNILGAELPGFNVIAQAQLQTQQQIAENTLRNAIAAEMIYKAMGTVTNNQERLERSWRRIAEKNWGGY